MSDIPEALGSAVEGGLLARAVEKEAGESGGHGHSGSCLNCGTELVGGFCHACGQKADIHRSLAAVGHDLIHGVLHLDGKLWRTLPMLAFRPGQLTRRYIDGQRARFVSPMAMFLFSVFLMFAVFQLVGLGAPTEIDGMVDAGKALGGVRKQAETESEALRQQIADLPEDAPERADLTEQLNAAEATLAELDKVETFDFKREATVNLTGIEAIDKGLVEKWRKNPGLMLYKLQSNGYKFSWLLIPLSIPFVWLLFAWRRRFKAYDHAIFVTYSLSFMSLLFIVLSILSKTGLGGGWIFTVLLVIPPIHIYKQLRGTYELSRFSAFWRMAVLSTLIVLVVLLLFLQILLLLGAF